MYLDYGYRSKCCLAPIRMGEKKIKKTQQRIKVWICCVCQTKDVLIITKEEAESQRQAKIDSEKKIKKLDS